MRKNKEINGFLVLILSSFSLCVSFSLALYSSNLVSMRIGDQELTILGTFSGWASVFFQPWVFLLLIIESLFGCSFYQGWGVSVALGIFSSIILSVFSWIFLREKYRYLWIVSLMWIILSILNFIDLKKTTEIRKKSDKVIIIF